MKPALTFQQWGTLYRMQAAGCLIDSGNLSLPSGPIEVVNLPSTLGNTHGSNLFVRQGGSWLALNLKIRALSDVNLRSLRVRAHWLGGELSLIGTCPDHKRKYCLPLNAQGQHVAFEISGVLNDRILQWPQVERGHQLSGYLLAQGPDFRAKGAAEYLDAQICLDDPMGREMVFPIVVVNRPMSGSE
jgi:hypothetical protein